MPFVNFASLKHLSPKAFKLYVYFLHLVQAKNTDRFALPLVDLGYETELQPFYTYRPWRHGKDGQLRNALQELIDLDLIEKHGQRGRAPNTYIVKHHHLHTNPDL